MNVMGNLSKVLKRVLFILSLMVVILPKVIEIVEAIKDAMQKMEDDNYKVRR
jgi:hypothetical protein